MQKIWKPQWNISLCGVIQIMNKGEKSEMKIEITKNQAKKFYRDLCGTVYGNANKNSCGVMSIGLIADHMRISIEKANAYCNY